MSLVKIHSSPFMHMCTHIHTHLVTAYGRSSSKVHCKANPKRKQTSRGQSPQTQNSGRSKVRHYALSVQFSLSVPRTVARQPSLSIINSWSLLKLMSIESVMPSNHLILCHPYLLLPSIFPRIRIFSNESALHIRWPKYWSFSFSISSSNECSGLISFRMDWFDLLAVRGSLKESSPTP